jgi:hypothetical protein
MLIEKSMELYRIEISNLSISVKYGDVSNSHGCPINGHTNWGNRNPELPRSYPGWRGQIQFESKCEKNILDELTARATFRGDPPLALWLDFPIKFKGFHTGTGCPGRINEYKTNIEFYFFLDDFPLLKKNKEKYSILSSFQNDRSWDQISLKAGVDVLADDLLRLIDGREISWR